MKVSCVFSYPSLLSTLLSVVVISSAPDGAFVSGSDPCNISEWEIHPVLCHMVERLANDPEGLAVELADWAKSNGLIVDKRASFPSARIIGENKDDARISTSSTVTTKTYRKLLESSGQNNQDGIPVVFAHGMGDSCFNDGMQHITAHTAELLGGVYGTCIPTGDTQTEDTTNGYFLNMDASVDVFAEKVRNDPQLKDGFKAVGFSQGNNVIRGYIGRYNDPPVHSFLSINGVNGGIGAVPYCRVAAAVDRSALDLDNGICHLLMEQASRSAYTAYAQEHSFQANYWRDPRPSAAERYQKYGQLAVWNNEVEGKENQTLVENWAKTTKFIWVLATGDGMVWPREGEQWGAPDPLDPFNHILRMNETEWYQKDLFGLRTAQEAGKNIFESFDGDHLQFSMEDFDRWVNSYLLQDSEEQKGSSDS